MVVGCPGRWTYIVNPSIVPSMAKGMPCNKFRDKKGGPTLLSYYVWYDAIWTTS